MKLSMPSEQRMTLFRYPHNTQVLGCRTLWSRCCWICVCSYPSLLALYQHLLCSSLPALVRLTPSGSFAAPCARFFLLAALFVLIRNGMPLLSLLSLIPRCLNCMRLPV